jgi:hypothetical protein
MARQVFKAGPPTQVAPLVGPAGGRADAYLERLLKLIPVETVAVYVFIDGILRSALGGAGNLSKLRIILWIVFAVVAVGNLLYLKTAKITAFMQYVVMTAAFVVWILSLGGPFNLCSWYQPYIGSVVLALFTFFIAPIYKGVPIS